MENIFRDLYEHVAPRYPNNILSGELLRMLELNPNMFDRDNHLATLVSYLKYMNEDEVLFWSKDIVRIVREIEKIYGKTNLINIMAEGGEK